MQRARRYISWVVGAIMMVTLVYGFWRFPDAPIHPCSEHGYCGKQGQPHSQQDFAAFHVWETALIWMWPPGMLALYLLQRKPSSDYEKVRATYDSKNSDAGSGL